MSCRLGSEGIDEADVYVYKSCDDGLKWQDGDW